MSFTISTCTVGFRLKPPGMFSGSGMPDSLSIGYFVVTAVCFLCSCGLSTPTLTMDAHPQPSSMPWDSRRVSDLSPGWNWTGDCPGRGWVFQYVSPAPRQECSSESCALQGLLGTLSCLPREHFHGGVGQGMDFWVSVTHQLGAVTG